MTGMTVASLSCLQSFVNNTSISHKTEQTPLNIIIHTINIIHLKVIYSLLSIILFKNIMEQISNYLNRHEIKCSMSLVR